MKRLAIIFSVMCVAAYLMLSEKDKKEFANEGKKMKKKFMKSYFPGKEAEPVD